MSDVWTLSVAQRTLLERCVATALEPVPDDWVEFRLGDILIGQIPPEHARLLTSRLGDTRLQDKLDGEQRNPCHGKSARPTLYWHVVEISVAERSERIQKVARALSDDGFIRGWRNEQYACYGDSTESIGVVARPPAELFRLERAAFRFFGLRSTAVHINGYRGNGNLWIGRRSIDKAVDPGQLDNLAAGGLPAGESPEHCAIRELWEEAGINPALAQGIRAHGMVTTRRVVPEGLHHEDLRVYDLELPEQITPKNIDGEVSAFYCMSKHAAIDAIGSGAFTGDASVVTARFLLQRALAL